MIVLLFTLQLSPISLSVSRVTSAVEVAAARLAQRWSERETDAVCMGQEAHVRCFRNWLGITVCYILNFLQLIYVICEWPMYLPSQMLLVFDSNIYKLGTTNQSLSTNCQACII
jgi:hypothetical protein